MCMPAWLEIAQILHADDLLMFSAINPMWFVFDMAQYLCAHKEIL